MKKNSLSCLLSLWILVFACVRHEPSNVKARSVWMHHQKVVEAAAHGETVDLNAFSEAARFFESFGLEVPGDHAFMIDWYPTKETAKAITPLRHWYETNGERLYWDQEAKKVRLRP